MQTIKQQIHAQRAAALQAAMVLMRCGAKVLVPVKESASA